MSRFVVFFTALYLVAASWARGQETTARPPYSLERIIELHSNYVPCPRLTNLIRTNGINFEMGDDAIKKLKAARNSEKQPICDAAIREAVEKGKEFAREKYAAAEKRIAEYTARGLSNLDQGDYPRALAEFDKAKAINPTNKEVLSILDTARSAQKAEDSVGSGRLGFADLERLLKGKVAPKRVASLVNEREVNFTEFPEKSEKQLRGAGADDQVIVAIAKSTIDNAASMAKSIDAVRSLLDQGKYTQAMGEIERAKAISPVNKDVVAYIDRTRSAQRTEESLGSGRFGFADLERLLQGKVAPKRVASLVNERDVNFTDFTEKSEKDLRGAGADDQVIVAIKTKLVSRGPSTAPRASIPPEAIRVANVGAEMVRQRKYQEALEESERALALSRSYDKAWELQGDALRGLKRFAEAVASYEKALEVNNLDYFIWVKKGLALNDLSRYEEAVASFDKALNINPVAHAIWVFKGDSLLAMKRCNEAGISYDKALEINPRIQLTLAERYERLKKCGE